MGGHSLTAVGSVLYNCGGSTPWKVTNTKHACYVLNTTDKSPTWSYNFDLPKSMKNFHTAIVVEAKIWFFDRMNSILHVLDTASDSFSMFNLPFTVGNYMCVTIFNKTTLIAIDTSAGDIYTIDNVHDPEKWNRVRYTLEKRFFPVCFSVDSNVFITGDGRVDLSHNFEVYDVGASTISQIPTFVFPRIGYALFELNGSVAVAGGMYRKGSKIFTSVETFNKTVNEWQIHDWKLLTRRVWFALAQMS